MTPHVVQAAVVIGIVACVLLLVPAGLSAQASDQTARQPCQGAPMASATHVAPLASASTPSDSDGRKPASDAKSTNDGQDAKKDDGARKDAPAAKADPQGTPATSATALPTPTPSKLSRWFELQSATMAARYRSIENSKGVLTDNQMQDSGQFKGRVKFDSRGRWTVNAVYATGNTFTGGWNNTGIGTGDLFTHWYLKQFYLAYVPVTGVELSYGGMGFARGESTEITTYDNDGFVIGERISVRRPKQFYLDEFGAVRGYLGDTAKPSFTDRYGRVFGGRNYYQIFGTKQFHKSFSASGDYARASGVACWHGAVTARTPAVGVLDTVRFEHYRRYGTRSGSGYAVYGEKAVVKRVTIGFGYANIDTLASTLNADRFGRGRRFYETASIKLTSELTAQVFWTQAAGNVIAISNQRRLDVVLTYNVLGGFQRLGWFR